MKIEKEKQINYGNWVSTKIIYSFFILFLLSGLLLLLTSLSIFPGGYLQAALKGILFIFFVIFLICSLYFVYSRYLFSPQGRGIQNKIVDLLISYIHWNGNGTVLDIGCGSGALSIKIAKKYKKANVTGIDYWGGIWEYSKIRCEDNARAEGVMDRLTFQRASASSLPFKDESFDLVVSNLVFHEVKDVKNKYDIIKESLRVLKKGGTFVFQDLFLIKKVFGSVDNLLEALKSWGIEDVKFVNTSKSEFIPNALKLPFMVGTIAIIYGVK